MILSAAVIASARLGVRNSLRSPGPGFTIDTSIKVIKTADATEIQAIVVSTSCSERAPLPKVLTDDRHPSNFLQLPRHRQQKADGETDQR